MKEFVSLDIEAHKVDLYLKKSETKEQKSTTANPITNTTSNARTDQSSTGIHVIDSQNHRKSPFQDNSKKSLMEEQFEPKPKGHYIKNASVNGQINTNPRNSKSNKTSSKSTTSDNSNRPRSRH